MLSRLTLVQAHYGANPPISRSAAKWAALAIQAVTLWPENISARIKCGRPEDYEALVGDDAGRQSLLEADAPTYNEFRTHYNNAASAGLARFPIRTTVADGFTIAGDDFVVLDGDHT